MTKQRHIPQTCPVCGAALPHDNPMSREYHEHVVRRSNQEDQQMSLEEQIAWCREHHAIVTFDEPFVHVEADKHIGVSGSLQAAILATIQHSQAH